MCRPACCFTTVVACPTSSFSFSLSLTHSLPPSPSLTHSPHTLRPRVKRLALPWEQQRAQKNCTAAGPQSKPNVSHRPTRQVCARHTQPINLPPPRRTHPRLSRLPTLSPPNNRSTTTHHAATTKTQRVKRWAGVGRTGRAGEDTVAPGHHQLHNVPTTPHHARGLLTSPAGSLGGATSSVCNVAPHRVGSQLSSSTWKAAPSTGRTNKTWRRTRAQGRGARRRPGVVVFLAARTDRAVTHTTSPHPHPVRRPRRTKDPPAQAPLLFAAAKQWQQGVLKGTAWYVVWFVGGGERCPVAPPNHRDAHRTRHQKKPRAPACSLIIG